MGLGRPKARQTVAPGERGRLQPRRTPKTGLHEKASRVKYPVRSDSPPGRLGGLGFRLCSEARIIHQASIRTRRGPASWGRCMMRSVESGAAIYWSTSRVRRFFAVTRTRWSVIQGSSVLVLLRAPLVARFVRFLPDLGSVSGRFRYAARFRAAAP